MSTAVQNPNLASATGRPTFSEMATNAIRFWEPMRIVYNLVLAGVVVGHTALYWQAWRELLSVDLVLWLFMLAVMANLCYCAAYIVDLFVQFSDFRALWRWLRWGLFLIGTSFAAVLTRFFVTGQF
jgi:hypothetical protein